MKKELVIQMIDEKMKQMEEASSKNILTGNLNFGLHLNLYKESPFREALLKKKRNLNILLLVQTFTITAVMIIIFSNVFEGSFLKGITLFIVETILTGFIFVYYPLQGLIVYANDVQKEVKKIILEDLKNKINKLPEENA